MINSVVLVGRTGQDPEMKYFESGKVKTTFSIAVNRWDSKEKKEVADWFRIELWNKDAEFAGEYVKKGRLVGIEGRLVIARWTDKEGTERDLYSVTASRIRLLGSKSDVQAG